MIDPRSEKLVGMVPAAQVKILFLQMWGRSFNGCGLFHRAAALIRSNEDGVGVLVLLQHRRANIFNPALTIPVRRRRGE